MPCRAVLVALLVFTLTAFAGDVATDVQQAKQAMLAARYTEAVTLYTKLVAELPDEPVVRFNLALALHSLGRYAESTRILEGIQSASKSNPKYWFLLGEGYLRQGQAKEAVPALERAKELSPSDFDTSAELASACLESGRFPEAQSRFQSLTNTHPEEPQFWAGLALSETGAGNANAAEQAKARLMALPESAVKFQMLARINGLAGHGTEAIQELRFAQKLDPGNSEIQGELARALIGSREFEQASAILQNLLERQGDNAEWQFDYGDSLLEMGKAAESIPHLKRAVELDPRLLPAQAKLGEALLQTGLAAAAVPHLELAALIDKDGSIHFQLAAAYRRSGKLELAAQAIAASKLLSKKP